ncbi:MAG: hypothetical protein IT473_02415 [Lysobacter sp.]|nr:hypothetical protein [Lysobacter sp.]
MSDRDATAETKEPYALARRGLPLRGIAPTAPRARWLPPVVRAQAVPTSRASEPATAEASPFEDAAFDPFAIAAPLAEPSSPFAPSPLIRDAGSALSIIADEGFEREAPASMPSRTMFDSADGAAAPRTSPQVVDTMGSETDRTGLSATNARPTPRSTLDPFAPGEHGTPATTTGHMSTPSPIAVDVPATATTMRAVAPSESLNVSAPRGAIASREREVDSMPPVAPSSPIAMPPPQVAVSPAKTPEPTPPNASIAVAPDAEMPPSNAVAQARTVPPDETTSPYERREVADARNDAHEPAAARLRHETVEMGAPSATPSMPRETGDATARAFAPPRSLDAAQIAALLSPTAASNGANGPSVTIDRVQVTVQTPATARPAATPAPQASASAQRQAASPGNRNPSYSNPWASYFARRD